LNYLGIGYARESGSATELFKSPAQNAFLHLTDENNGTDIGPEYAIAENGLTLGVNSENLGVYSTYDLSPDMAIPGEFQLLPGCFSFPGLTPPQQFCGNSIFDIGIQEMLIKLPCAEWPAGTHSRYKCKNDPKVLLKQSRVPSNVEMSVALGASSPTASPTPTPVVSDPFTTGTVTGPAPAYVSWQDTTGTSQAGTPIVNTGRNPLACYNYVYQGQCGVVGFQPVTPVPSGCPTVSP